MINEQKQVGEPEVGEERADSLQLSGEDEEVELAPEGRRRSSKKVNAEDNDDWL